MCVYFHELIVPIPGPNPIFTTLSLLISPSKAPFILQKICSALTARFFFPLCALCLCLPCLNSSGYVTHSCFLIGCTLKSSVATEFKTEIIWTCSAVLSRNSEWCAMPRLALLPSWAPPLSSQENNGAASAERFHHWACVGSLKWLRGTFKYSWNSVLIPLIIIHFSKQDPQR